MAPQTVFVLDESVEEKLAELRGMLERIEKRLDDKSAPRKPPRLLRLEDVLDRVNFGATKWWEGVKTGLYPRGTLVGNFRVWLESDIDALVETIGRGKEIDWSRKEEEEHAS